MKEVTLSIRHHGEPESDIGADYPDVTLRSISSLTGSAAKRKRIVELTGPASAIEPYLEDFVRAEPILAVDPLTPLNVPRVLVKVTYDNDRWDSISERLTDLGIHYRTGTVILAGWERWTVYLEPDDDLSEIVDVLVRAGNDVDVVRSVELVETELDASRQLELSRTVDTLTSRQREILRTAISSGYYQRNRSTSIEDIAESVGIASSTAWEHLTVAEGKVMEEVGAYLLATAGRETD